jgi:hypothetical protein
MCASARQLPLRANAPRMHRTACWLDAIASVIYGSKRLMEGSGVAPNLIINVILSCCALTPLKVWWHLAQIPDPRIFRQLTFAMVIRKRSKT